MNTPSTLSKRCTGFTTSNAQDIDVPFNSQTLCNPKVAITINLEPEPGHDEQNSPKLSNFETVASYNWLDEPKPTILVPGQSYTDQGELTH